MTPSSASLEAFAGAPCNHERGLVISQRPGRAGSPSWIRTKQYLINSQAPSPSRDRRNISLGGRLRNLNPCHIRHRDGY